MAWIVRVMRGWKPSSRRLPWLLTCGGLAVHEHLPWRRVVEEDRLPISDADLPQSIDHAEDESGDGGM